MISYVFPFNPTKKVLKVLKIFATSKKGNLRYSVQISTLQIFLTELQRKTTFLFFPITTLMKIR